MQKKRNYFVRVSVPIVPQSLVQFSFNSKDYTINNPTIFIQGSKGLDNMQATG